MQLEQDIRPAQLFYELGQILAWKVTPFFWLKKFYPEGTIGFTQLSLETAECMKRTNTMTVNVFI